VSRARRDLLVLAVVSACAVFLSIEVDLFEVLLTYVKQHEAWQLDEVFVLFTTLACGLCVFSARRWSEMKREVSARRRAEQTARHASSAKSDFLARMSHEIRTPMTGVVGMTELALDTLLTVEQRDCLETVLTSAHSLLGVIDDILDFSKIEAAKLDLDCIPFGLRKCVGETLKSLAIRAHRDGLRPQG
jgi:signal transduction histidine kinase